MNTMGDAFRVSAAVLGSLGLVATSIENLRRFSFSLEEHFWTVLSISFVLSLSAAWPTARNQRPAGFRVAHKSLLKGFLWKYRWIVVITLTFLAAGFYRYHIVNSKGTGDRPVVKPGDIPLEPASSLSFVPSAYAYEPFQSPKLASFALRHEKTLYIETERSGKKMYLLPGAAMSVMKGRCTEEFDRRNALLALRAYAKQSNKERILKYIESEEQLQSLVAEHRDIARELMPTKIDWSKLGRADYFAILNWVRNCVGIFFPVFIVTIENPTNRDLLVTGIKHNVLELERYPPTDSKFPHPSGSLTPTATYTHQLVGKQGVQSHNITPAFRVPANSSGAFELQLHAKGEQSVSRLVFNMNIELVTNQSPIRTARFLLSFDMQSK